MRDGRGIIRIRIGGLSLSMALLERLFLVLCAAFLVSQHGVAGSSLDQNALKMLHDPSGWEYIAVLNLDNGVHG